MIPGERALKAPVVSHEGQGGKVSLGAWYRLSIKVYGVVAVWREGTVVDLEGA